MKRWMPRSLFGQTLAIILAGLALSQLVGAWIYANDRTEAVHAVGGMAAAQRIANLARLVEESPPEGRGRIVRALNDPTLQVTLSSAHATFPTTSSAADAIRDYLAGELSRPGDDGILVALSGTPVPTAEEASRSDLRPREPNGGTRMGGMGMGGMGMGRGRMDRTMGVWRELAVAVRLDDDQWLSFTAGIPDQTPARSWWFFASLATMGLTVLAASAWATRRATAPLRLLGEAADRFGRDPAAAPLVESGPAEMRTAIQSFNRMQLSLQRLVDNRSRMLAGVSHDLRTPLTLLRLRIEAVENGEERDRMLATIADMEGMVAAALDFARQTGQNEARRPTDMTALVASIVDDMADAGIAVAMATADSAVCRVQPAAMKRALTNLIDNAVKFGGGARIKVEAQPSQVAIIIEDRGPGIPAEMLPRVFEPFFRIEESRSRDTGGSGLGLAIALAIVQTHGGQIALSNRPTGGLEARVTLPDTGTRG